jgi:hypothetical protein
MQAYSVLVCKQHYTAIVNLDKYLLQYYNVPVLARRQIVNCFSCLKTLDLAKVKLLNEPTEAIKELRKPLPRLEC